MAKLCHCRTIPKKGVFWKMSWYAIFVVNGCEDEICLIIDKIKPYLFESLNYNLLVPKRKIYERKQGIKKEVIKKMFPGYVLLETDNITDFYMRAKNLPHIINFLKNNNEFLEVSKEEIHPILHMADKKGLIDISQAFIENEKIAVKEGPLFGREDIIKKVDKRKGRAKVEFILNQNSLLIDLGINIVKG